MRKSFMAVLMTSMLLLAGCVEEDPMVDDVDTTDGDNMDNTNNTTMDTSFHDLVVWHSFADGGTEKAAFDNVMADFAEDYPNYNITLVYKPFDDMPDAFVTASLGGEAPDIVRLQNDRMGGIAANTLNNVSIIEPLNNYLTPAERTIYGPAIGGMTANGDVLGLPQSGDSVSLYFNKAVLMDAGVDYSNINNWTWMEFMDAANASTDVANDTYGLMFPYKNSYQFWAWMAGMGGAIFNENGLPTINSDATIDAINLIRSLVVTDENPDGIMLEGADWGNMEEYFKDDRAAFMIQGPWAYDGVEDSNVDFGQANLPLLPNGNRMAPFVGLKGWSMSSASDDKEGAATVAKYLTGIDAQIEFAQTSQTLPVSAAALASVTNNTVVTGFGAQMGFGFGGPAYEAMGTVWGPADSMLADVFDNELSPEDAVRKAQAAIEKANGLDLTVNDDVDMDGVTINDGDCDDNNASIFPGAPGEMADDGIDTNCDGQDNPYDNVMVEMYLGIMVVSSANGMDAAVGNDTVMVKGSWSSDWSEHYEAMWMSAQEMIDGDLMDANDTMMTINGTNYTIEGVYMAMFNVTIANNTAMEYHYEWGANTTSINWFGTRCLTPEGDMDSVPAVKDGGNCQVTVSYDDVDMMWFMEDAESIIYWMVAEA